MLEIKLDSSVLKIHEVESMFVPGMIMFFGFLYFYPSIISFSNPIINWEGALLMFIVISYGVGFIVHDLGKWVEKIIIEKLFYQDLKRIDKIGKIVSKAKAAKIIDKKNLILPKGFWGKIWTYCKNWIDNKSDSQEAWEDEIDNEKRELKIEKKDDKINSFNSHNKFMRSLIVICFIFITIDFIKNGKYIKLNLSDYSIFVYCIILVIIFAYFAMRKFEINELKEVYNAIYKRMV